MKLVTIEKRRKTMKIQTLMCKSFKSRVFLYLKLTFSRNSSTKVMIQIKRVQKRNILFFNQEAHCNINILSNHNQSLILSNTDQSQKLFFFFQKLFFYNYRLKDGNWRIKKKTTRGNIFQILMCFSFPLNFISQIKFQLFKGNLLYNSENSNSDSKPSGVGRVRGGRKVQEGVDICILTANSC